VKINPFGPLTDMVALFGDEGRRALRGDGLLYICLRELAEELEELVSGEVDADQDLADEDQTDQDQADEDQTDEDEQLTQTVEFDADSEPSIEAEQPESEPENEVDETDETDDEDASNPFSRKGSQVTSRTRDLQSRLDQLRSHDKEIARQRGQTPDEPSEAVAPGENQRDEPENLHERIEELNRLRERYLGEQRWEDLAQLYEEGIELFVEPVERQQVFLTLAMLYEVKLKRLDAAFEKFVAAYLEEGTQKAKDKAFEGLQRLGRQSALQVRYVGFLEKLADRVETDKLGDFYVELFEQSLPDPVFEPMAVQAAHHHVDCGEVGMAMEYYEQVLDRLPEHEIAFHSLAQLYEDAGRLTKLLELYRAKTKALGQAAPASLQSEIERIQVMAQAAVATD
jgi:tetratricopeptide (TPR) repeat protein